MLRRLWWVGAGLCLVSAVVIMLVRPEQPRFSAQLDELAATLDSYWTAPPNARLPEHIAVDTGGQIKRSVLELPAVITSSRTTFHTEQVTSGPDGHRLRAAMQVRWQTRSSAGDETMDWSEPVEILVDQREQVSSARLLGPAAEDGELTPLVGATGR
ncbi:MAG: hypothetical protein Q4G45_04735 [Actinomycetia bacterium]|nr:hypothetical protein [Actinomycetes bacterium]